MVAGVKPLNAEVKDPPLKFEEDTLVPEPLANPLVVLYSIPYAVTDVQPVAVIEPAKVAVVVVMEDDAPVVTDGEVLIPAPVTATLIAAATPPPLTGMFPLKDCTAVGVNLTNICCENDPPGCVMDKDAVKVPVAAVANVYPVSGPTSTLVVFNAEPVMVKLFGPAAVLTQTFPKPVRLEADKVGVSASVVKLDSVP